MDERYELQERLEIAVANDNPVDIMDLVNAGANINGSTRYGESFVHLAVRHGCTSAIAVMGLKKANLDAINDYGATPMEEAVRSDNAACIKELLSVGAKMDKRLFRGDTYLHIAASEHRNGALQALLDAGHEIDAQNYLGETPLMLALKAGNDKGMEILLQRGADAKMVNKESSLQSAVMSGDVDLFESFIETGMVTDHLYENGDTLIHSLVRSNNATELLKVLNQKKGKVGVLQLDKKNTDGFAPLHFASDPSVVRTLLDMGANVNVTTEDGKTALHIASANGAVEVVKVLTEHNVGIDILDNLGNTALIYAIQNSKSHVTKYLLFCAADPRIKNENGWTALHYAAEGDSCKINVLICVQDVTVLLDAGARVNEQDINGFTPAFVAAINNKLIILQNLIKHGADLAMKGTMGAGIIHEAANRGLLEIVTYLLDTGVDVDSKDSENGWTALHYAVERGRKKMATLLLDRKADSTIVGEDGRTALQLAFEHRHLEIAKLLIEGA
ncbi:putative ankyrin repeat protein RF_0381 isoform X2 [Halyomorpha halys]|uniref:putative ankyrin repeat protein RF_0381 isoform X2 n=1 Tax=Halyomorpha halys TaxID=286706 RepID=UPI0006D4D51C|nr:uncharacterized protein LOC106681701 isoform X2 [Halyomorpha halys]